VSVTVQLVSSQSELLELVMSYEREIIAVESREQIELKVTVSVCVTVQLSYKREIVVAEACKWSKLEPGVQKNTGAQPVRI
jgi:hypothetical protein